MMNDTGSQSCSPRAGRNNRFLSSSFRAIVKGASSLASTVRSAGSSVASSIGSSEEDRHCEQLQWASFDNLELGRSSRRVLLLTYTNGFQVWDVENADDVLELVSKRDGPVAFLRVQPQPFPDAFDGAFKSARPLLLVVTTDSTGSQGNGFPNGLTNRYGPGVGSYASPTDCVCVPTVVKFYSLRNHTYVHTLRFRTAIHAVRCSSRVVVVALASQLYCFDAVTLQSTFSVLTYPSPQFGASGLNCGYGAVAVGSRWLAYAANQPLVSNTGRVSPQHLAPSPSVSPSTSPAKGSLVTHYAKESSKQLAAGIVTLGDYGYKALSKYYSDGSSSPVLGSSSQKGNGNAHPEHAGIVIIRDLVTKAVISQFRAHGSPLSALCFDPSGTLLVTASINGHNINVFRILPVSNGSGPNSTSYDANTSHVHLYKLSRGLTNAVIQDIAFSEDSHWIVISSSRGTNHLFAICPFGGIVGPHTHGAGSPDRFPGRVAPWWSNFGPLRSSQHSGSPPPPTINSSVISRIKNGNGGWLGAVTASPAASAVSLGAVAVSFHDAKGQKTEIGTRQASVKQQLWVLSPSGHLIRYALRLLIGTEGYPEKVSSLPSVNATEALDISVAVDPLQKWDVCRRPSWVEREEKIENSHSLEASTESSGIANTGPGCNDLSSEGMHQWFLSNAEVQMHHFRPPLWVKPQISFNVFSETIHDGASGGEVEIEKVPTRLVEVRKRDLVPVYDRLKEYQFRGDVRAEGDILLAASLNPDTETTLYNMGNGFSNVPYSCSGSGSSCSSNGSLCNGSNVGFSNNNLHSYQGKTRSTAEFMKTRQNDTPMLVGSPGSSLADIHYSNVRQSLIQVHESQELGSKSSFREEAEHVYVPFHGTIDPCMVDENLEFRNIVHGPGLETFSRDTIDSQFDLKGHNASTEDTESSDGNDKIGVNGQDGWEGAINEEQGEDELDGSVFPFAEDC